MEAALRPKPNQQSPSPARRFFLPGRMKRSPSPSLVFDPEKCTGCRTCEMICSAREEAFLSPASAGIRVIRDEEKGKAFAVFCQHCRDPVCMDVCPTKAIQKGVDGIVRIEGKACVHCGLCAMACPEAAPLVNPADGRIHKCDLCQGDPECVKHCPEGALVFSKGRAFPWIRWVRWPVQAIFFLLLVVVLVGTFCSLSVGGFQISCPLGVLQNIASSMTFIVLSAASGVVIILLSFAAGRIFCGWICPFGFVLDVVGTVMPRKSRLPLFLKARAAKYGVLTASVGGSLALGFQAFCPVCPIGTLCRSYGVQGGFWGYQLAILPALAALEIGERRSWCRYFCPVGALLALAAKLGMVRIFIGARKCKKFSCKRCADICPMGIIDHRKLQEGISPDLPMEECIFCMRCVDQCPYDAAKVRFRWWKGVPKEET
ncbi:MAG: 4Fe-4S binding protein [Deltaproteobacteria bacterium]|nr:4Fe-4S binding protein [Deltaproteobacteria bacterium]